MVCPAITISSSPSKSGAPGVEIADWLRDRYPEEMTIVIQHWYDGWRWMTTGFPSC